MHLKRIQGKLPDQANLCIPNDDSNDSDWKEVHEKVKRRDDAMLRDFDSEIDTLLVFAGLFSAVLTAFIVDVYQDLGVDYTEDSATVLRQILAQLRNQIVEVHVLPQPSASPSPPVIIVIVLWFVSLVLSLLSALFSIFVKQWLHTYAKWTEVAHNNLQQGLILRGFYQANFKAWRIPAIFTALGVLLQVALVLFVIGLVAYLWTLNFVVSSVLSFFAFLMVVLSAIVIILPVFYEDCPYKFPFGYVLLKIRTCSSEGDWTERDVPIAKRHLHLDDEQPPLIRAIAQTALLLEIAPDQFEKAIFSSDWESMCNNAAVAQTIAIARSRVHELSAQSTTLLSRIVTSRTILQSDLNDDDDARLMGLWQITLGSMADPPLAIFRAIHYLEEHITDKIKKGAHDSSKKYMKLLVTCILPQCSNLPSKKVSKYALASELSRVALVVCEWADASENSLFTAEMSLMALTQAAMCIPLDESTTGISPITPFLPLLGSLEDATLTHRRVMEASYEPTIQALLQQATQLYSDLRNYHTSFLCTQSRGYKTTNTDEPRVVRFSYDNAHLFVGTDELAAWILNTETGESFTVSTAQLPNSLSFLYANFTRDGKHVYWGSREGPLYLFKPDTGEAAPVEGLGYGRRSRVAAISHDEMHVLVVNETDSAAMCDATTGETIMTFEGHSKRLCRAAFASVLPPGEEAAGSTPEVHTTMHPIGLAPDELEEEPPMPELPRLATSSCDNTVRIWDVCTGSCVAIFDDLGHSVNGVCWSSDATLLAITCSKAVRVYEVATRGLKCELEGHTKLVCNAAFSPNGQLLVSASNDHTVRVWNVAKKTCIAVLTGPDDDVNDVEFSPDGRFIAAAADDSVWIWDINPFSVHRTTDRISMLQGFGKKQKDKIENMADFNS